MRYPWNELVFPFGCVKKGKISEWVDQLFGSESHELLNYQVEKTLAKFAKYGYNIISHLRVEKLVLFINKFDLI